MTMEVEETRESQSVSTPSFSGVLPKDRRAEALGDLLALPDETLCSILVYLSPRDVGRLACVSSIMYIFCNEEPLWMTLCLQNATRLLQFKGSWKKTTLHQLDLISIQESWSPRPLHFEGFYSLFLYRRLYRCYTTLAGFSFDEANVERRKNLSFEEFNKDYDCQKPVLILGLSDTWPARNWTLENLVKHYGDTTFRLSQRGPKKITMKFGDYVSYMQMQHDEDPLYVFDDKFGEVAPSLLEEYSVPHLFQEDFFDVLSKDDRPPFRWLIIGPERSGAAWHVDPALTSAWNTLLYGRKRWALYPPGKVPLGVTVHVNEDDGEVHIDTPSSLQWWLDFYPLLSDVDKPIECTQLPGETILVPSGWWHCVLNLETTVAVTQNFVNSKNFEFVCLDMAPGYKHKGVCRAGLLALEKGNSCEAGKDDELKTENVMNNLDLKRKEKRARTCQSAENSNQQITENYGSGYNNVNNVEFSYTINFLSTFLDEERDHFISLWRASNVIEQRKMREWLFKLWVRKPELRDLIWKGACLALNASRWFECLLEICQFHELPLPKDEEKLPVGTGSNPVYLVGDNVIKIFAEGGLEATLFGLGTELEFYYLLDEVNSQLKNHVPRILGSGILSIEDGSYKVVPWDGKGVPEVIRECSLIPENHHKVKYAFGIQNKMLFEYRKPGLQLLGSKSDKGVSSVLPYVVTERCRGKMFAELRETLSLEDTLTLASYLGEKLRILHLLPCQCYNDPRQVMNVVKPELSPANGFSKVSCQTGRDLFIKILNKRKKNICSQLIEWGNPVSSVLVDRLNEYLPKDFEMFFAAFEDDTDVAGSCTWIHSDVMDDNIQMEPSHLASDSENASDSILGSNQIIHDSENSGQITSWRPCHLIDFSDLSLGHPICDIIPVHLDVFRGDSHLMQQFLETYKLPLVVPKSRSDKFGQASYLAMCLCILHDDNVLAAIFSLWKELRTATSWEEIEEKVWGDLNTYKGFC